MKIRKFMALFAMVLAIVACDEKGEEPEKPAEVYDGTLTIDASDYTSWTYINLITGETQKIRDFSAWNYLVDGEVLETAAAQGSEADITIDWQIAIHRYDIKTNGGSAVATLETEMSDVTTIPASGYVADETTENTIITDMTGMMSGKIGYAASEKINTILCSWLTKTPTGTMPPYTYDPTNLIYVVKCKDGNYAKLKFTDYQSSTGTSGHVTFSYQYISQQ